MGDTWPWGGPDYVSWHACREALSDVGMDSANAVIGAAVGTAESSRDLHVVNDTPATGDYSVGIWQINYYGALRAERTNLFGSPHDLATGGLDRQARTAYSVWTSQGWNAWSTYTHDTYKQYLHGGGGGSGGGGEPTIGPGASGPAVTTLQGDLNQLGHNLTVDGQFGPATESAVKAYQRTANLKVDGVVGPATWASLDTATGVKHHRPVGGPQGPIAPIEPPGHIDGGVLAAWGRMAEQFGQAAAKQVQDIDGFIAVIDRSRK